MFFPDPALGVEMWRVLAPRGRLAVLCGPLAAAAGYRALAEVAERVCSPEVLAMLRSPFALRDERRLAGLVAQAGIESAASSPARVRSSSRQRCARPYGGASVADPRRDRHPQLRSSARGRPARSRRLQAAVATSGLASRRTSSRLAQARAARPPPRAGSRSTRPALPGVVARQPGSGRPRCPRRVALASAVVASPCRPSRRGESCAPPRQSAGRRDRSSSRCGPAPGATPALRRGRRHDLRPRVHRRCHQGLGDLGAAAHRARQDRRQPPSS